MSERVMRNRRKIVEPRVIKVSGEVYQFLIRKRDKAGSWDAFFRRAYGLPDRKGAEQPLVEGFLEINSGKFFLDEDEANGAAVMSAAKRKTKRVDKPIRLREVV